MTSLGAKTLMAVKLLKIKDLFRGVLLEVYGIFASSNVHFKARHTFVNHLIVPNYISKVSASRIYRSLYTMIKVWQAKCDVARGGPFSAHRDIKYPTLDGILAWAFGRPGVGGIARRLEAVLRGKGEIPYNIDEPITFPDSNVLEIFATVLILLELVGLWKVSVHPEGHGYQR
ncbi:hypothetical protein F5Y09DRAFT_350046 [Xylaria sp. FL1042]|nr:hypothetical protein F5Y09DRAFT_350046 [Xylaria sp. FL1042]